MRIGPTEAGSRREAGWWLVVLGLVATLGQVVLLRELLVAFYGSELVYLLALGLLLLATALGALAGRRLRTPTDRQVRWLFVVLAVLLPLLIGLLRGLRLLLGGIPGAYLPFEQQLVGLALALLPFGAVAGLLFQRAAVLFAPSGGLAWAYAAESLGGLLGGGAATLSMLAGCSNLAAGVTGAMVAGGAAVVPWPRAHRVAAWTASALVALAGGAALAHLDRLDRYLTSLDHPDLLDTRDTPYGRVTIASRAGQLAIYHDGALTAVSQGTEAEEYVALAGLQAEPLQAALVLGGSAEGLVAELLAHRPARIDAVELDSVSLAVVRRHRPDLARSWADPPVRMATADPRRFLETAGRYDLILVAMPEPASGQANRFYTREFFQRCRAHLRSGGVLALRIRAAENLWTPALERRAASIHRALTEVFADALVLPGSTNFVLASDLRLERDPEVLVARHRQRRLANRLVGPEYLRYLYTNDRLPQIAGMLAHAEAPANTDQRPVCYQYTLLLWLSRFYPSLGRLALPEPGAWLLLPAGLWLATLLVGRRSDSWRGILLMATAGFNGMVLEVAVLLGFQTRSGVLYQDLGWLVTAFMAGLGLGAAGLGAVRSDRSPGSARGLILLLLAGSAATALLAARQLASAQGVGLLAASLLLLAAGALVGATFAGASRAAGRTTAAGASSLYAADLLGGCAGCLAATLLLVPVLGLPVSAATAGAAAVLAAVLL